MPRSAAGRAAPSRAACARVASSARVGPLAGRTRTHAGVAVPRARVEVSRNFSRVRMGEGRLGAANRRLGAHSRRAQTQGRLSKMLCDATKYFDERPSPNRVSHAGARCDGIRNLPRIARRKQPPPPLSTLCLLPLSHLPRRRPRPCRHAVPPPSHRAYALGLSLRAARRSSPPSTSPSQEIKSYQGGCAKRKPSLRVALLVLQLLFPCAASRGRAALELVPHREHPLDDLEILRAAPVE